MRGGVDGFCAAGALHLWVRRRARARIHRGPLVPLVPPRLPSLLGLPSPPGHPSLLGPPGLLGHPGLPGSSLPLNHEIALPPDCSVSPRFRRFQRRCTMRHVQGSRRRQRRRRGDWRRPEPWHLVPDGRALCAPRGPRMDFFSEKDKGVKPSAHGCVRPCDAQIIALHRSIGRFNIDFR